MTDEGKLKSRRQLRSVDDNLITTLLDQSQPGKDLFDFDPYLIDKIPVKLPILVSQSNGDYDEYLHENEDLTVDTLKLSVVSEIVDLNSVTAQPLSKKRRSHRHKSLEQQRQVIQNDPLDDSIYMAYLTRMDKEERKMMNMDKSFLLSEYDKLCEQLKILNVTKYMSIINKEDVDDTDTDNSKRAAVPKDSLHAFLTNQFDGIPRKLQSITKLNDAKNYKELKIKYKLTIKELNEFVKKYNELKLKEVQLRNEKFNDSDDEEDLGMDVEELRQKRLQLRAIKYGPVMKVNFYDCVLIMDPINPPKIRHLPL